MPSSKMSQSRITALTFIAYMICASFSIFHTAAESSTAGTTAPTRKRTSMMKLEEHNDAPPSGPLEEMRPTPRRGALTSSPNDDEEYNVNTKKLWKNEVSQNQMILVMN